MSPELGETSLAADVRAWGDQMQSEASRLAAAADFDLIPYEAQMALVAVERLVTQWTDLRRRGA